MTARPARIHSGRGRPWHVRSRPNHRPEHTPRSVGCWLSWYLTEGGGGVARPGGGAGGACPHHLPRGRRGSKVKGGRSPSRSDAEGALDFGGAAPYASATPPPEHPSRRSLISRLSATRNPSRSNAHRPNAAGPSPNAAGPSPNAARPLAQRPPARTTPARSHN